MPFSLLNSIASPTDLRRLSRSELRTLARELREFVLQTVSRTGGHLSSNLGTVELTIALHAVYNTPFDRVVWDVGHQTYPHKILTGRREAMASLKHLGGISGFPRRSESDYDTFGTGHSSTSISAALGMAHAATAAHLRDAQNIAHTRLRPRLGEVAADAPLVVHCASGLRAAGACAFLERAGREVVCVADKFENAPKALFA